MTKLASIVSVLAITFSTSAAVAAPDVRLDGAHEAPSRNAIFGDVTTLGFINSTSISYERVLHPNWSLRVGYLVSSFFFISPFGGSGGATHGPFAMVTALFGDDHNFEVAAGVSLQFFEDEESVFGGQSLGGGAALGPRAFVGYRYQPTEGGTVIRVGLNAGVGFDIGVTVGAGYSF